MHLSTQKAAAAASINKTIADLLDLIRGDGLGAEPSDTRRRLDEHLIGAVLHGYRLGRNQPKSAEMKLFKGERPIRLVDLQKQWERRLGEQQKRKQ